MADDDIVIGGGDPSPGVVPYQHVFIVGGDTVPSLFTHSDVSTTSGARFKCVVTHGCVLRARRHAKHGVITERIIFVAIHVGSERVATKGVVELCQPETT